MMKQSKILVGSLVASVAVLFLTAGTAFAQDDDKCGCCKDMMPQSGSTNR